MPKKKIKAKTKVKKIKRKKIVRRPKVAPPSEEAVNALFQKGRMRGFFTETELMYAFPEVEEHLDFYEKFLDRIEQAGLNVVETRESILGARPQYEETLKKVKS